MPFSFTIFSAFSERFTYGFPFSYYFFPVFAFAIGIAIAELVRAKERDLLHWRH